MGLVNKDEMTVLRSASEAKQTAKEAEKDRQLMSVAYAINEASNTGLMRVVFQGELIDEVKEELQSKGYHILNYGAAHPEKRSVISWET